MGERPFVIEDLTEIAGIDPEAARRAYVKIRSVLLRWLVNVLSARTSTMDGRTRERTRRFHSTNAAGAEQRVKNAARQSLSDGFTQDVGIALAGPGELDHSPGDNFVGEIAAATCKLKGHAGHFECDPEDALGLGIALEAVEVRRDGHRCAPICSGGSATGLSATGA
jgi:hypothetical protein